MLPTETLSGNHLHVHEQRHDKHVQSTSSRFEVGATDTAAKADTHHMTGFHFSTDVLLLFDWWHPTEMIGYAVSLVLIFLLAIAAESLTNLTSRAAHPEHKSSSSRSACGVSDSEELGSDAPLYAGTRVKSPRQQNFKIRECCQHALSISINFLLMLLVMTLNIGVCAAVVCGLAIARTMRNARQGDGRWGLHSAPYQASAELCH